ncbi:MAG: carboxy-terminal-processing protease, carboxyl-terminal processing protease, partial [Candidatus Parcubacteria bacterium]
LIRGKKGTEVKLTIGREGVDPFEISVVRDVINIPTLDTKYDQSTGIFTIRLYNFTGNSTTLFRNALRDFVATKSNKLIIDLRGNPGGYLEAAVDMASWFLPAGEVVVREDFGPSQAEEVERSSGYNIFGPNLKIVILVDGGSASASEIFAGALSEYGKATLVGTQTFGKGSVQEYMKLDDKTSLKVTIARWLTPKGVSISDGGLKPQYEVKITPEDAKAGKDPQLEKAIELLK